MSAVILACSSLKRYVNAAQGKMATKYPVVHADRKYHKDPRQMKEQIIEKIRKMPAETDTLLVAMGFCGGSWESISCAKRIVIPRVDDCSTLLLHAGGGRIYTGWNPGEISVYSGGIAGYSRGGGLWTRIPWSRVTPLSLGHPYISPA